MRSALTPATVVTAMLMACAPAPRAPDVPSQGTRSYFMGFSIIPPKPDVSVAIRSAEIWTRRSDAAIMHLDVPWALLLAGTSPAEALRKDGVELEHYYRGKHLRLVVTIDVTNGLARESEAPALVCRASKHHRAGCPTAVSRVCAGISRDI